VFDAPMSRQECANGAINLVLPEPSERLKRISMRIAQVALSVLVIPRADWRADWAWGLPLIVLTVVIHVSGLGLINRRVVRVSSGMMQRCYPTPLLVVIMGSAVLLLTALHGIEAGIWAAAYHLLGALPGGFKAAMLYSLNAITSYGHESLSLDDRWQLMGAMEALNGWLLFGLTTAFLFGMYEKVWASGSREAPGTDINSRSISGSACVKG